MLTNSTNIERLCGCADFAQMSTAPALRPFDETVCAFLAEVSAVLRADARGRAYPDVLTYAFFCRKANINQLKSRYEGKLEGRLGRGITFHIAPSNVPINFAYTLTVGLLAGNVCIVKASGKDFPQTRIVAEAYANVLNRPEFAALRSYVNVMQYSRDVQDVTEELSARCNVRVIWGGDETVAAVRRAPLAPRAFDVTFADRYSIAVMDAKTVNEQAELSALAHEFYNDTYLYDQNACSSPRLMYWIGKKAETDAARNAFWQAVWQDIHARYPVPAVIAVDKQMAVCRAALGLSDAVRIPMPDNRISRIEVGALTPGLPDYRCAGGSFIEYCNESIDSLADIINEKYQTLAYYGLDAQQLRDWVIQQGLHGIDRIVPVGKTADWDPLWDGYDLILTLSRKVAML